MIPNRPHSMKRYSPIERPAELSAPLVKAEMKMFRYLFPWKKTNMVPDMQNKTMLKAGVFRNCINTKDAVPLIFDMHVLYMFCHAIPRVFQQQKLETNQLSLLKNYTWDFHLFKTTFEGIGDLSVDQLKDIFSLGSPEVLNFGNFGPYVPISTCLNYTPKVKHGT